jgi:hypothetical protein
LRGGLRGGLDRDRVEGPISSATSFPRNIRPFDRSQVCTEHKFMNLCNLELELSTFLRSILWYFYFSLYCHHSLVHPQVTGGATGCDCVE